MSSGAHPIKTVSIEALEQAVAEAIEKVTGQKYRIEISKVDVGEERPGFRPPVAVSLRAWEVLTEPNPSANTDNVAGSW
jgi:hypothetical protein